ISSKSYYLKIKKLRSSLVIFIFILFTLHAIFLTYSRSTLIMFLVSSITMAILIRKKKIILIIFGLLFLVFFMSYKDFYIENINLFRVVSSKARIYSMENALQIIKDHPLIGVGFNTYRYTQIKYGFRGGKVAEYSHADAGTDNSFLFVLATTGIIGFGAYIYLFWSVLLSAKSKMEDKKKMLQPVIPFVLIASLVGLFFNALLINSLFFPFLMEWIWILLGITSTSIKKIKESS
ncbi:MAG: O-antigen ligase family protein, partial [Patescibacteria group bacterium]|nr:O-antigen ligase family protein [Patescibacteria group bacterium]